MYLTSYSDCLTYFCEPLLPPNTCHTGMKKCLPQTLMNYSVTSWFGETFGACHNLPETTFTWLHLFFTLHESSRIFSCEIVNSQHHFQKCMGFSYNCSPVKCTVLDKLKTGWCLLFVVVWFWFFFHKQHHREMFIHVTASCINRKI